MIHPMSIHASRCPSLSISRSEHIAQCGRPVKRRDRRLRGVVVVVGAKIHNASISLSAAKAFDKARIVKKCRWIGGGFRGTSYRENYESAEREGLQHPGEDRGR